jgi:hypothetical protein
VKYVVANTDKLEHFLTAFDEQDDIPSFNEILSADIDDLTANSTGGIESQVLKEFLFIT